MAILVVNPNASAAMSAGIDEAARGVARPGTVVRTVTSRHAPASIEGYLDGAFAVPGLVAEAVAGWRDGAGAVIVACFDDTGVDAVRSAVPIPVLGLCEAALKTVTYLASRATIVTTLPRSIAPIAENVARYGYAHRVAVRASGIGVLELEDAAPATIARLWATIERTIAEDGAEAIVLGCAGMAPLARRIEDRFGTLVVDGVAAAVTQAEALVALGLGTAKGGAYAAPLRKPFAGALAPLYDLALAHDPKDVPR